MCNASLDEHLRFLNQDIETNIKKYDVIKKANQKPTLKPSFQYKEP